MNHLQQLSIYCLTLKINSKYIIDIDCEEKNGSDYIQSMEFKSKIEKNNSKKS